MRTIVAVNLVSLLAISALAQDRNFPAALSGGVAPVHPAGSHVGPPSRPHRSGYPAYAGYGFGFGGYGYDAPYADAPPVANSVVLVQAPAIPAPPPEPIHSSIQNVKIGPEESPASPPAFFVIVLKNGSRVSASMVWVQGELARYIDTDGQGHRVPLADVDRAATRELNQANHLNLRLPPPAQ